MRTLTGVSRLFLGAALAVALLLGAGGAYFIGYVGQLERELSAPASAPSLVVGQIESLEQALGHTGFLKSYRAYWQGDARAHPELLKQSALATRAAAMLVQLSAQSGTAVVAREVQAVAATFADTAAAAPATPPSGLRGINDDSLKALPNPPQLETAYVALSLSLARLREGERGSVLSALGGALNSAKILIVAGFVVVVSALMVVAWVMRGRVVHPLSTLERSLAAVAQGALAQRVWGAEREDEIGALARAGDALRRRIGEAPAPGAGASEVTFEGPALVLFEKLTAQVASAVEALRTAGEAAKQSHDTFAQGQDRIVSSNDEMRAAIMAELKIITDAINGAAEQMRGEVTRLIEHIDEERLLPTRGGPKLLAAPAGEPPKTLADVPKAEVLERLGDLAAEMHAVAGPHQRAAEVANDIEERSRAFLEALGQVTELGADDELSLEGATMDVETLARTVAKLEARAEALSELAVTRRFDGPGNVGSPAELDERAFAADLRTDGAIQAVFESIERLNNVAAALARAGDAERQRRVIN